jgi:AI-2 transport protein TqsA
MLVGALDACILWGVGVSLWLVFGVLAFWLSFVPNIGFAITVLLPMPLVMLDPSFSSARVALAFFGPLAVGMAAKDIVEPLLIGHSTRLTPVAVLLSVMLWGSIWGVTGMVLAVPLTAVARIHMEGLEHPLPQYFAAVLSGSPIDHESEEEEAERAGQKPTEPSVV